MRALVGSTPEAERLLLIGTRARAAVTGLTSPLKISLSLNTKLAFALPDSFSACNQNRTSPFSKISTANSEARGTAAEEKEKNEAETLLVP